MTLPGFDPKWHDFPDYIIGITREIWEQRQIHTLHQYYAPDIVVRSPSSLVIGNKNVIAATMATLAEFPDRTLLGEEVIWNQDETGHFLSSHRIFSTATHTADGLYGRATGKRLHYRIIADCAARDGVIDDEWLIRDQGAVVRQLGIEPEQYARDLIEREGGIEKCVQPFSSKIDKPGPYKSRGNDSEVGERYKDLLERIMSAEFSAIESAYDRACSLELPGGVSAHSYGEADHFWMNLRSAFPSASFNIEHVMGLQNDGYSPRAAIRWSLSGKHAGYGRFGTPSGADVYLMGISHAEFGPRGLRREYILFDDTAVWKQILMQQGSAS